MMYATKVVLFVSFFFFFFQAEDGIRDLTVTGVQTCALPIFATGTQREPPHAVSGGSRTVSTGGPTGRELVQARQISGDRKSTRLNSSHSQISYAVFCLKKKKKQESSNKMQQ